MGDHKEETSSEQKHVCRGESAGTVVGLTTAATARKTKAWATQSAEETYTNDMGRTIGKDNHTPKVRFAERGGTLTPVVKGNTVAPVRENLENVTAVACKYNTSWYRNSRTNDYDKWLRKSVYDYKHTSNNGETIVDNYVNDATHVDAHKMQT